MRSHKNKQTNKQTFILSSEINSHFSNQFAFIHVHSYIQSHRNMKLIIFQVIAIIALLNVETIFFASTSKESKRHAEEARRRFSHPKGDHFMLLSVYLAYSENRSNGFEWCKENSIDYRSMQKADV